MKTYLLSLFINRIYINCLRRGTRVPAFIYIMEDLSFLCQDFINKIYYFQLYSMYSVLYVDILMIEMYPLTSANRLAVLQYARGKTGQTNDLICTRAVISNSPGFESCF